MSAAIIGVARLYTVDVSRYVKGVGKKRAISERNLTAAMKALGSGIREASADIDITLGSMAITTAAGYMASIHRQATEGTPDK